ncbi:hypothetical protein N799_03860 [Lysobacter arseniciresistens ZS79]|uniref:General secretion pathway protein GspN n=1 Tax=Lysobacter arseniciresistens ZS79 TaxID=913325 RepID=A0A0A0EW36_9GAMM|nr:hypothetical protein [Lysobacter arseniciresistens]KGM55181.1 hypothetical protein N799_03860 [Lysobacter arseniciresistens ZS79]
MRIEDAGPRTWLLAGVAGWALLAWVLAAAGMGGRVVPLPDDPTLLQPLPPVRPAPPARLGAPGQYAGIAARPLFSPDRQPAPFFLQGGEEAESTAFDYQLTSVMITPRLKLAIIQPADGGESVRVRLGDAPESHPSWRLSGLSERSAVFEGPEGQRTLGLRVFDGVGGARPTEVGSPSPDAMSPGAARPGAGARTSASAAPAPRSDAPADAQAGANAEAESAEDASAGAAPSPDDARMEAIRARIQARRARLHGEPAPVPPRPPLRQPPVQSP